MTILHLLAAYGLCFGLMNDKAKTFTDRLVRLPWGLGSMFRRMLECAYCTGFHCGWLVWLVSGTTHRPGDMLLWAFASAAFCYTLETWVKWLEPRTDS